MIETTLHILDASWGVLVEAGPYLLFGFFVAGLLKGFVPDKYMARHLGKKSVGSIFKAAIVGVPLPLCSCGVLPTALGLRKQGASKGATTAFMISTPETGVDSMAVTYALIDPIMTVIRPVAASITAVFAGVLVNAFPDKEEPLPMAHIAAPVTGCGSGGCGCSGDQCDVPAASGVVARFRVGMQYAFGEMIADIGRWLLIGVVIAGIISAIVPADALDQYVGTGFLSYLVMLVVALPLYVCATASTPIAASLLLKGLSPGAALVFLLAGPATNGATITVMLKTLGKRAAGMYVVSIVVCSLALAWATDMLYSALGLDITAVVGEVSEILPHWVGVSSAVITLVLVGWSCIRRHNHNHDHDHAQTH
ncbi:SO_0444 family Cu/Zn efflux transporter [Pseudodesulfovibrio sp. JC047]|uniref:SO_0444 family Cu/Zn efflux transporter n=1 Tax=Pseudodesulfovibrio sp. JC047 TaxID=2683199 RepID=UPI0013D2F815|nr:SO_0444 family Cu/Zn efflux transporter [Pseudodesulfovibrio sp. JC047]NDV19347.1 SO_0444 family Cu/Zn efflux transporter [Pseudodesulfovibrio sp. JC047]